MKRPAAPIHDLMLNMGYWPAAERERQFAKEPDRTEHVFYHQGHLVSAVCFLEDELGWVIGYMLGYNDGKTSLWPTAQEAVAAHRAKALVLADPEDRDPYGVLTLGLMADYRLWAEGWLAGYEAARDRTQGGRFSGTGRSLWAPPAPDYADVRDALMGLTDMPYTMACALALWLTRDHATQFFLSSPQVL